MFFIIESNERARVYLAPLSSASSVAVNSKQNYTSDSLGFERKCSVERALFLRGWRFELALSPGVVLGLWLVARVCVRGITYGKCVECCA